MVGLRSLDIVRTAEDLLGRKRRRIRPKSEPSYLYNQGGSKCVVRHISAGEGVSRTEDARPPPVSYLHAMWEMVRRMSHAVPLEREFAVHGR